MKKIINHLFKPILIFSLCSLIPLGICGQKAKEVLTNTKIIELSRLGLSEAVIIEKIRQSDCQCDTSTTGLAKLKAAKIPDAVIMAMLGAAGEQAAPPRNHGNLGSGEAAPSKSAPADASQSSNSNKVLEQISEAGIYLYENGEITQLEPTVYSGSKTSVLGAALTYGIKKTKIRAVVRGKSANLQAKSARPEFYFVFNREYGNAGAVMADSFLGYSATSPAEFMMVVMKQKENSREAVLGEIGAFSATTGAPDQYIREYSFEKIKLGVYKVVPKNDLAPGEYCFYYAGGATAVGATGGKVFDFSVANLR